jgi:CubicO group peptidase (beta-lactamase class C family)
MPFAPESGSSVSLQPSISRRRLGQLLLGGVACSGCIEGASAAGVRNTSDGLPRSQPELHGVRSGSILAFLADVEHAGLELHSFMMSRNGSVIAEGWWWPYKPKRVHMMHSLTKSVMVSGVALALDEGRFRPDDKVVSFFPEHLPPAPNPNLLAMTVRDLLTMRTGHDHETSGSEWRPLKTSWIAEFMKIPVVYPPGTKFVYTSAASYMLSAIVTKTTGQKLADYLRPRILEPMGISDFQWDVSPEGVTPGGNGLSWTTADSLKLGMLYEQKGVWRGKQLLSPGWVAEASKRQFPDDPYGYQWWIGPGNAFYAAGLFNQLSIVFPQHNAVLAVCAAVAGTVKVLDMVWKHFPSLFDSSALPPSPDATALRQRESQLLLLKPYTPSASSAPARISSRLFKLASNDQAATKVQFEFSRNTVRYSLTDDRGSHSVTAGLGGWIEQSTTMTGARLHHEYQPDSMRVVAGAVWRSPSELEMTWQFVESAFRDTVVCLFNEDRVSIDRRVNVNSGELKLATLNGKIG